MAIDKQHIEVTRANTQFCIDARFASVWILVLTDRPTDTKVHLVPLDATRTDDFDLSAFPVAQAIEESLALLIGWDQSDLPSAAHFGQPEFHAAFPYFSVSARSFSYISSRNRLTFFSNIWMSELLR